MLVEVLRSIFRKVATTTYPKTRPHTPEKFRGKIAFHAEKCIGCRMCVRDCPANAIEIVKIGEKRFEARFDLARCIYCAQCVDSCLKKVLESTKEFELASLDRAQLKVTFDAPPAPPTQPQPGTQDASRPAA